jgi:hypothetical protein
MLLRLIMLCFLLAPTASSAAWQTACGCEWNPWTKVTYLSCAELRSDGSSHRVISQQPFDSTHDCEAAASRIEKGPSATARAPAGRLSASDVDCNCEWNPWKSNFLLSCSALRGDSAPVRIIDRMAFGAPKGQRQEAERSCMTAKLEIEKKAAALRAGN